MKTLLRLPFITAFALLLFCISPPPSSADTFPDAHDAAIEKAVGKWWGDFPDALYWKAQLWQESRLKTDAVSPAGARGISQFMPATWEDVVRRLGLPRASSPHEARLAIDAGAFYMAQLRAAWTAKRPEIERHRLAQASYNAGLGNILKAQKLCGGARDWPDISPCLTRVTGRHARETQDYVPQIAMWRGQMAAEGER